MKYKISDICDLNCSSITSKDKYETILYLETSSITNNKIESLQTLSMKEAPSRAKRKVNSNTIIYSTVRPNLKHYGILKNPADNLIVSTGFATIDIKDKYKEEINAEYLYLLLSNQSVVDYLSTMAESAVSAYPSINPDDIGDLSFNFPDIDLQSKIAKAVFSLENKIALNTRMNSELEAMAKQLYDYWFIQFDFPDENGKPYKSSGGKMVYSEKLKREIPEGWDVKRIGDYANIFTGKKDVSKVTPGDYLFFSCAPDPITSNDYIYDGEVVLVSGNGSYTGRTTYYKGKCDLYQRTYACVLKEKYENYYPWFYQYMKNYFEPHYSGGKHGSAIPYIILSDLTDSIIVSRNDIIKLYSEKVRSIFNQIYVNHYQIIPELTHLRDSLLPMLMNGQVTVE